MITEIRVSWWSRLLVFGLIIAIWEISSFLVTARPNPFPPPSSFLPDILENNFRIGIGSQATSVFSAISSSVLRVVIGMLIACAFGIPAGIVISETKLGKTFLLPFVQLLAPIAPIAWIPIMLAILGVGNSTAIAIVFLGVFFLFTLTITNAVSSIDKEVRDSARVMGISNLRFYRKVVVPSIMPAMISSMRINLPAAWMAVLAAEMTGLRDGLGAIVMTGRNLYDYDIIMFGVFFIAVIGLLFDVLVAHIRNRYFWW
ncbi:MAG: ABC transporter permease subunit [Pseudomonadota bacterium]